MFVDNVDNEKCGDYISGTTWARSMGDYAPYTAWQLEAGAYTRSLFSST